ncbi:MAG TPA: EAL domain-containing protein [Gemmatimonadales bacterium]
MANSSLTPSVLRSRFGRRLLLLFVVCSLLPSLALALLSFGTVTRQLRQASLERLEHSGRLLANDITDRLRFIQQDLSRLAVRSQPCPPTTLEIDDPACDGSLEYSLTALAFVPTGGHPIGLFGPLKDVPVLTEADQQQLAAGRAVVIDRVVRGRPRIYLVRRTGSAGWFIGQLDPAWLWGGVDRTPLIPTMQFHVVNAAARVISQPDVLLQELPESVRSGFDGNTTGTFDWEIDEVPFLAAFAPVPDVDRLALPLWTLVVSEARTAVIAPMDDFKRTFPVVIALAVGAALVLSLSQLRRSLAPLDALHAGTRRLTARQFDQPVVVTSRDEFAEVAASFNAMTNQIQRQFSALATAAEVDRAVLSSVDTNRIVQTVLQRMRDVCACDVVGVTLLDPFGGEEVQTFVEGESPDRVMTSWSGWLMPGERERLSAGPTTLEADGDLPVYLQPLAQRGSQSLLVFPLRYQSDLLGAIALGSRGTTLRADEDLVHAKRLAGQVALALTNARMVDQIRRLAFYDSLTGLPNRLSFKERLGEALERGQREGSQVGVCFLDLDHFSRINDTLGHKVGDRLVQEVGRRVSARCGEVAAIAEVARLGGDEFTVMVSDLSGPEVVETLARRILESFATPFALDGYEVFISTSIGVAIFPADGDDLETLLKNADVAMYQAKQKGRNRIELYADAMSARAVRRLTLENHLRKAMEAGQFELWYQPIANLKTGRIESAEALIRWQHPELGWVPPGEFIPVCEESGLIVPMGEWILRTVCAQNVAWQREGLTPIPVAINISGQQLRSDATVELVRQVLETTGLSPQHLILELTESILMQGEGEASTALQALARLGVGLAIDDFGTGYSSLSYLKHFPVNTVKIDKSFVLEVTSDADDAAITSAIIAMGSALGLKVIAEGVERQDQVAFLREQGCDAIQGYLVGYPLAAPEFRECLVENGVIGALQGERRSKRRLRRAV